MPQDQAVKVGTQGVVPTLICERTGGWGPLRVTLHWDWRDAYQIRALAALQKTLVPFPAST